MDVTISDTLVSMAEFLNIEGLAQRRAAEAASIIAKGQAEHAEATIEAATAMHKAGEQMRIVAMKMADIHTLLRLQGEQIKLLSKEFRVLKHVVENQEK